jgi:plasmid stabilization system protein ParE
VSTPVIFRPAALADIERIYDELDQVRAGLGEQFAARLRNVLELIEAQPRLYGVVWEDMRAVRLRQFQYVLYYVTSEARTDVLAVVHGARKDSSWKSRRE